MPSFWQTRCFHCLQRQWKRGPQPELRLQLSTFKFFPHLHQLIKALKYLLDKNQDTILYAPTSAGKKCLIAQAYPLLWPSWVLLRNPSYPIWREASQQDYPS